MQYNITYNAKQQNTLHTKTIQYNTQTIQYNTNNPIQQTLGYNTIQRNPIQETIQYDTVRDNTQFNYIQYLLHYITHYDT